MFGDRRRSRRRQSCLQALEKGGQGANAKFTYSCDGHSECGGLTAVCVCEEQAVRTSLTAANRPPQTHCLTSIHLAVCACVCCCSIQLFVSEWIQ